MKVRSFKRLENMQKNKEFVTMRELLNMGILPYTSYKTMQRKVYSGEIKAVFGTTSRRPRIFIPMAEVERLKRFFSLQKTGGG